VALRPSLVVNERQAEQITFRVANNRVSTNSESSTCNYLFGAFTIDLADKSLCVLSPTIGKLNNECRSGPKMKNFELHAN